MSLLCSFLLCVHAGLSLFCSFSICSIWSAYVLCSNKNSISMQSMLLSSAGRITKNLLHPCSTNARTSAIRTHPAPAIQHMVTAPTHIQLVASIPISTQLSLIRVHQLRSSIYCLSRASIYLITGYLAVFSFQPTSWPKETHIILPPNADRTMSGWNKHFYLRDRLLVLTMSPVTGTGCTVIV